MMGEQAVEDGSAIPLRSFDGHLTAPLCYYPFRIISSPITLLGRKAWEGDFETPFLEREVGCLFNGVFMEERFDRSFQKV